MSDTLRHEFATRDVQAECPHPVLLLGCLLNFVLFVVLLVLVARFLAQGLIPP